MEELLVRPENNREVYDAYGHNMNKNVGSRIDVHHNISHNHYHQNSAGKTTPRYCCELEPEGESDPEPPLSRFGSTALSYRTLRAALVVGCLVYASVDGYHRYRQQHQNRQKHPQNSNAPAGNAAYVGSNVRKQGRVTMELTGDFETKTLIHKPEIELDPSTKGNHGGSGDENANENPNVGIPIESYKATYHYTSPKAPPAVVASSENEHSTDVLQGQRQYFLKESVASKLNHRVRASSSSSASDSQPEPLFDPQIAWLASFPNSGTSFTLTMVARATNTTFATNYGIEANYGSKDEPSMPIYPRHPEGPFMPNSETSFHHRSLPYGKYVITKTHCGGYCFQCNPADYAYGYREGSRDQAGEDPSGTTTSRSYSSIHPAVSFLQDCASGHAVDTKGNLVDVAYPPERVSRVIHLYRNPLHNVIARFHLERKHHGDANTTQDQEWLENHPDDRVGLQRFCASQNKHREERETAFFASDFFAQKDGNDDEPTLSYARRNGDHLASTKSGIPTAQSQPQPSMQASSWNDLVANVPCKAEFFRYIQWHNLLHEALDYVPHKLPVLTVYYEDYGGGEESYRATTASVLEFLELEPIAGDKRGNVKWTEFRSRTDYDGFFSDDDRSTIASFLRTLASFRVWGEIEHYFAE
ncbi:unnamed protein product [Pseudo-nitzschia multistriata]|uniref:Sulfotransferase domain-containing protein n=1 Tax=Pseudo-nitzschia multistriata TaxID=183589 RepID=A0A448ZEC4_9STRA|nr:unnamed protein product [Pseudo-nitzschia multistriata]